MWHNNCVQNNTIASGTSRRRYKPDVTTRLCGKISIWFFYTKAIQGKRVVAKEKQLYFPCNSYSQTGPPNAVHPFKLANKVILKTDK